MGPLSIYIDAPLFIDASLFTVHLRISGGKESAFFAGGGSFLDCCNCFADPNDALLNAGREDDMMSVAGSEQSLQFNQGATEAKNLVEPDTITGPEQIAALEAEAPSRLGKTWPRPGAR